MPVCVSLHASILRQSWGGGRTKAAWTVTGSGSVKEFGHGRLEFVQVGGCGVLLLVARAHELGKSAKKLKEGAMMPVVQIDYALVCMYRYRKGGWV
jgi:hypothetical protein